MDQREWDYGARMSRERRAAEAWPTREPEIEDPEPRWASLTDTGSMAPSPEALTWQRRADAWAQQAEIEPYSGGGGHAVEPANQWSEVASTGRPTFPADGAGWRTETAEWRATGARWRQTTEWRSSTGSHVWRSTTEAWQAEAEAAAEREKPAIAGTAWPTPDAASSHDTGSTRSWQQPSQQTPTWQEPAQQTPSWQEPAQQTPSWQQSSTTTPSWQQPSASSTQTPSWQEPSRQTPSWQEPARPEPTWQEPARAEPTWQEPARQTPSWQLPDADGPASRQRRSETARPTTPVEQTPSWRQPSTSVPAWSAGSDTEKPSWSTAGTERPSWSTGGDDRPSWSTSGDDRPAWSAGSEDRPAWSTSGDDRPSRSSAGADRPSWSSAGAEAPSWETSGRTGEPTSRRRADDQPGENTTGFSRRPRSEAPGWQTSPADDARHLVREDDRAAWRRDHTDQPQRRGGRRRAPEGDTPPSGGSGWSSGSDSDNWAGHTDTGSLQLFADGYPGTAAPQSAPAWNSRAETPGREHFDPAGEGPTRDGWAGETSRRSRRQETPRRGTSQGYGEDAPETPQGYAAAAPGSSAPQQQGSSAPQQPGSVAPTAPQSRGGRAPRYNASRTNWREDTSSWAAEPDTSNWTRDPDTGQWSRAEDDPRVLAWRAEAARREATKEPTGTPGTDLEISGGAPELPGRTRRGRRDDERTVSLDGPPGGVPGGPLPSSGVPGPAWPGGGAAAGALPNGAVPTSAIPNRAVPNSAGPPPPRSRDSAIMPAPRRERPGGGTPAAPSSAMPSPAMPSSAMPGSGVSGSGMPASGMPSSRPRSAMPAPIRPGGAIPGGTPWSGATAPGPAEPGDPYQPGQYRSGPYPEDPYADRRTAGDQPGRRYRDDPSVTSGGGRRRAPDSAPGDDREPLSPDAWQTGRPYRDDDPATSGRWQTSPSAPAPRRELPAGGSPWPDPAEREAHRPSAFGGPQMPRELPAGGSAWPGQGGTGPERQDRRESAAGSAPWPDPRVPETRRPGARELPAGETSWPDPGRRAARNEMERDFPQADPAMDRGYGAGGRDDFDRPGYGVGPSGDDQRRSYGGADSTGQFGVGESTRPSRSRGDETRRPGYGDPSGEPGPGPQTRPGFRDEPRRPGYDTGAIPGEFRSGAGDFGAGNGGRPDPYRDDSRRSPRGGSEASGRAPGWSDAEDPRRPGLGADPARDMPADRPWSDGGRDEPRRPGSGGAGPVRELPAGDPGWPQPSRDEGRRTGFGSARELPAGGSRRPDQRSGPARELPAGGPAWADDSRQGPARPAYDPGGARALPAGSTPWPDPMGGAPGYGAASPASDPWNPQGPGRDEPPTGGGRGGNDWLAEERASRRGPGYRDGAGQGGETDWRQELSQSDLAEGESRRYDTSDFPPFRPSGSAAVTEPSNLALSATSVISAVPATATPDVTGAGTPREAEDTTWPPRRATGSSRATGSIPVTGDAAAEDTSWPPRRATGTFAAVEASESEDTSWPPRRSTGAFQGTGSYERRPVTAGLVAGRSTDLLDPDDDEDEEVAGGPLAAVGYTVVWYGVPVILFVAGMFLLNSGQRTHALETLADAAPEFGISLALSIVVALGLRRATSAWKAASVGLASAVVGGGIATVLASAISGQSLS